VRAPRRAEQGGAKADASARRRAHPDAHTAGDAGATSSLSLRPPGRARVRKQPRRAHLEPLGAPRRRAPGERGRSNSDEDCDGDDEDDLDVGVGVDRLADDLENAPPPLPALRAPWSADWDSWQLGGRQARRACLPAAPPFRARVSSERGLWPL
jgi:hypothetical protein